ncbi:MAG: hypothetical protein HOP33_16035 [Verrucomicrobia bacterium]|nr:hypothetical protein [Verrucomicrobiota bacterium]
MNITNSQQFVTRCRRILIPWFAHTDAEAVRDMERSCMGIAGGMLLTLCVASASSWSARLAIVLFSISLAALSLFLTFRLRVIRQLFDNAGVRSFAELRERENRSV